MLIQARASAKIGIIAGVKVAIVVAEIGAGFKSAGVWGIVVGLGIAGRGPLVQSF